MRIIVDKVKCIGCGLCEEILPEVFSVGTYHARVKQPTLRKDQEESAAEAAADCPTGAISFEESEP
jgi:ferredoxin